MNRLSILVQHRADCVGERTRILRAKRPGGAEGSGKVWWGEAFHEPVLLRVADPRSGARLCEALRFMVPMHAQTRKEATDEPAGEDARPTDYGKGYHYQSFTLRFPTPALR